MEIVGDQVVAGMSSTVNTLQVLLNASGTGSVTTGTFVARPAASTANNIYVDTTNNIIWRDTGTAWVTLSGNILKTVTGNINAASGTTTVPLDNTTPQSTEGWQIWTQSFTPILSTSRIVINFHITVSTSINTNTVVCSVFAGTTNISTIATRIATANTASPITYNDYYLPGTITPITYSARIGATSGSTSYCNQIGTTTLGGSLVSSYTITEYFV